jgi:hypothetical protein
MNEGRCLCGQVSWQLDSPLELMSHCHCSRCRKSHGTPFATYVAGAASGFRLHGSEHVVRWESSPGFARCFCARCGSVVPSDAAFEGRVFVPAANFEDDPGTRPIAHIFVGSKAPWYQISDDLARFDAYPDGFEAPVVPDRAPVDPPGGVRGSCLCGEVTFLVEGKPLRAANCHCRRCRRGRSAAHAANLVMPADGVRFTRGEDRRGIYKVPDARYFTQAFCRTCGSTMPHVDRERGIAIVPFGSLDDDPGFRPQFHIFVGSRAPWFEITDDLPRHAEGMPTPR